MTRRTWVLLFPALLAADGLQEVTDWLGRWVQRLTEENASEFLRAFDKTLRDRMETAVTALVRNYEIASSISVLSVTPDGDRREVQLDWYLSLKPRSPNAPTTERRERVTLTLQPAKKGWQVRSLSPETFFSPTQNG
ncbi:MAG: hypothetical protein JST93_14825 [Acidobacteria bacterium]|nr:hypothetical protein [Acidobacteriota bacterium]